MDIVSLGPLLNSLRSGMMWGPLDCRGGAAEMGSLDFHRSPDCDRRARDSKPGPCLLAGCSSLLLTGSSRVGARSELRATGKINTCLGHPGGSVG